MKYWLSQKAIEIIEMPPSPTKKAAHLKAGYFIAENSDILIVLWDGNEEQIESLTTQIVARAAELNKPICHILADDFKEDEAGTKVQMKCGEISYINFYCQIPEKGQDQINMEQEVVQESFL